MTEETTNKAMQALAQAISQRAEGQLTAHKDLEIFVGSDYIIRINIDGVCRFRCKISEDAEFRLTGSVVLGEHTVTLKN